MRVPSHRSSRCKTLSDFSLKSNASSILLLFCHPAAQSISFLFGGYVCSTVASVSSWYAQLRFFAISGGLSQSGWGAICAIVSDDPDNIEYVAGTIICWDATGPIAALAMP